MIFRPGCQIRFKEEDGKRSKLIGRIGCLFVLAAKRQPIRGNGWIGKQDVLETPKKRREKKEALAFVYCG
jgi:hypothetical protein